MCHWAQVSNADYFAHHVQMVDVVNDAIPHRDIGLLQVV
jgi:hypothetical protein